MELELLKKFYVNNISMWNPNTNYLTYLKHFEKILNFCIENKTYKLTYQKWLNLLNTDNGASKIGGETHNICHGLNIIESTYKYGNVSNPEGIIISIPRELLYQYIIDGKQIGAESWKIIQNRYFKFLNNNNIFQLDGLSHIQRVCLNLFVCYLLDSGKMKIDEIDSYIKFAKESGEAIDDKISEVYNYDVCKDGANILEKLEISSNGQELRNSGKFIKSIMNSLDENNNSETNYNISHFVISIKDYSTVHKIFFDKYGYMYWGEGIEKKYNVGDIFYLYFSSDNGTQYSRIKKKAIITDIGIPKEKLEEEKYYEKLGLENDSKTNYYVKVKLIGDANSSELSFKNLNDKFGFKVPELGSSIIQREDLIEYIENHFDGNTIEKEVLTEETLGIILKEYYESDQWNKIDGIMLFGIRYGDYIVEKNLNRGRIIEVSGIGESYISELNKAISIRDFVTFLPKINEPDIDLSSIERKKGGFNSIYYGIPGCGKSYIANTEANSLTNNSDLIVRTTFYPDYTNSDFVGQIIPKIDDDDKNSVLYDIQGGPFTDALVMAIDNPSSYVCLIIEEINRGNAAAIFGDLFQLLDRNGNGESEYYIKNYTISKYLEKHCTNRSYNFYNISIPSNLILIGTMNTSDQNVFTLDTAFKRRWNMKHISNDIENSKYANKIIPILNITWKDFVNDINYLITHNEDDLGINGEDKQLGAYFISGQEWNKMSDLIKTDNVEEAAKIFAEKILSYIWEDVAKLDKKSMFKKDYKIFDDVVKDFLKDGDVLEINTGRE